MSPEIASRLPTLAAAQLLAYHSNHRLDWMTFEGSPAEGSYVCKCTCRTQDSIHVQPASTTVSNSCTTHHIEVCLLMLPPVRLADVFQKLHDPCSMLVLHILLDTGNGSPQSSQVLRGATRGCDPISALESTGHCIGQLLHQAAH